MSPSTPRSPAASDDLPVRRIDRVLAFMSFGLLLLSIICFVAIMIGSASGMTHDDFGAGIWPAVGTTVYIAPIVAFLATDGWWITGQTIFANGGYTTR